MGLDVYLYEISQEEQNHRHDQESEKLYNRKESGEITESEYQTLKKTITEYTHYEEQPSAIDPDHTFNRRYLRSSYNGSGFNRAVPDFLGGEGDLYWIFDPVLQGSDEYSFNLGEDQIDGLLDSRSRALYVAAEIRKSIPLRTESISAVPHFGEADHMWDAPASDDQALAWYREQLADQKPDPLGGGSWFNSKGSFFSSPDGEGLKILGAVPGVDVLGRPCVHLIKLAGDVEWYAQAAEITAEFCDEAIALIKRDGGCYMHWSG